MVIVWCGVEIGCDGGDELVRCRPEIASDGKRGDVRGDGVDESTDQDSLLLENNVWVAGSVGGTGSWRTC